MTRCCRVHFVAAVVASTLLPGGGPVDGQDTAIEARTAEVLQDSTWVRDAFERALRDYYMSSLTRYGGETSGDRTSCDGDMRQVCFGGDVDALVCPHGIPDCVPQDARGDRDFMVSQLLDGLSRLPRDPFILGQVIYALTKFGRSDEALDIAWNCLAVEWWCGVLHSHVLYATDLRREAHKVWERTLASMPQKEWCEWTDVMPLLPASERFGYVATPCGERTGIHELAWWLADPSWLVEGNDG